MFWTPEILQAYDCYRVSAGDALPFVGIRLDGWQVGERWCLTVDEACAILNARQAEPITSGRFKKGTAPRLENDRNGGEIWEWE